MDNTFQLMQIERIKLMVSKLKNLLNFHIVLIRELIFRNHKIKLTETKVAERTMHKSVSEPGLTNIKKLTSRHRSCRS